MLTPFTIAYRRIGKLYRRKDDSRRPVILGVLNQKGGVVAAVIDLSLMAQTQGTPFRLGPKNRPELDAENSEQVLRSLGNQRACHAEGRGFELFRWVSGLGRRLSREP